MIKLSLYICWWLVFLHDTCFEISHFFYVIGKGFCISAYRVLENWFTFTEPKALKKGSCVADSDRYKSREGWDSSLCCIDCWFVYVLATWICDLIFPCALYEVKPLAFQCSRRSEDSRFIWKLPGSPASLSDKNKKRVAWRWRWNRQRLWNDSDRRKPIYSEETLF
jgi:hypothetical protein